MASPPISASSPRKPLILFLALGGGLFAAIAGALVHENLAGENPSLANAAYATEAAPPRRGFRKRRYLDDTKDNRDDTRW